MGIGYIDSIVLYNRYENEGLGKIYYIGTRFDNARIELTQGANIRTSGLESADSCIVKIPNDSSLPKPYVAPVQWKKLSDEEIQGTFTLDKGDKSFFAICKKKELGIDRALPEGLIDSETYEEGFFEYMSNEYGYSYMLNTVDVYSLIPRFEIGGN
ncbi:MAG: hypothetical protein IJO85_07500 [Lachnospiraceae bacterium]|nr:hypothetical protein [Lachnospiraceae bacterium]